MMSVAWRVSSPPQAADPRYEASFMPGARKGGAACRTRRRGPPGGQPSHHARAGDGEAGQGKGGKFWQAGRIVPVPAAEGDVIGAARGA